MDRFLTRRRPRPRAPRRRGRQRRPAPQRLLRGKSHRRARTRGRRVSGTGRRRGRGPRETRRRPACVGPRGEAEAVAAPLAETPPLRPRACRRALFVPRTLRPTPASLRRRRLPPPPPHLSRRRRPDPDERCRPGTRPGPSSRAGRLPLRPSPGHRRPSLGTPFPCPGRPVTWTPSSGPTPRGRAQGRGRRRRGGSPCLGVSGSEDRVGRRPRGEGADQLLTPSPPPAPPDHNSLSLSGLRRGNYRGRVGEDVGGWECASPGHVPLE